MDKKQIWFWVIFVIIIIILIITVILLIVFLAGNKNNNEPDNPYPTPDYPPEDYQAFLDDGPPIDLNALQLPLNNTLRKIGIVERYKFSREQYYTNFKSVTPIIYNEDTIGSIVYSLNGNAVIFFDDFIYSKSNLNFEQVSLPVGMSSMLILKQWQDIYDALVLPSFATNTNLYVYSRGCSTSLGIISYFTITNNTGTKEYLFEGYPSMINDPDNLIYQMKRNDRFVFINNLSDPQLNLINTSEYDGNNTLVEFNTLYSELIMSNNGLTDYQYHSIINYFE